MESMRGILAIFFPLPRPLADSLFGWRSSVNSSKVQVLVYWLWVTLSFKVPRCSSSQQRRWVFCCHRCRGAHGVFRGPGGLTGWQTPSWGLGSVPCWRGRGLPGWSTSNCTEAAVALGQLLKILLELMNHKFCALSPEDEERFFVRQRAQTFMVHGYLELPLCATQTHQLQVKRRCWIWVVASWNPSCLGGKNPLSSFSWANKRSWNL